MLDARAPAPFLKWAGGKRQLVARILEIIPREIDTYYEPFVGGGAVFFALAAEKPRRFRRAVIADANQDLVDCYEAIKNDVDAVIGALRKHRLGPRHYYEVRGTAPASLDQAARAARLIYLNRCGYNGLYRVNSRGEFNVPFGRHRNPKICDEGKLHAASEALQRVRIVCRDFAPTLTRAKSGDFVYLDPPYVPLSNTSSFTAYASSRFGPPEQQRLAKTLLRLGALGVHALLSNSDCDITRTLYQRLPFEPVPVRRAINSVASKRGPVAELLVRSFGY